MSTCIRRAGLLAVPAVLVAVLTGCSGEGTGAESKPVKADVSVEDIGTASPADEPPSTASATPNAPVLKIGETGTWIYAQADEYGEPSDVTTKMQTTAVSAKYVTPAQIDTTNKPEHGQYVELTLTLKNVGKAPADIAFYGMTSWEDSKTAAQGASTLEGVGEGPELDTTYKPGQSLTGKLILDVSRKGGEVSYFGGSGGESQAPSFTVELPK
ncbi:DUF4352 domain-containing protein [Streptomyces fractus]|uniref:DUF4352 domain-containing protein n=1 Tax=Streptomyces fractus TaxID=641806 RepID=UPI003CEB5A09